MHLRILARYCVPGNPMSACSESLIKFVQLFSLSHRLNKQLSAFCPLAMRRAWPWQPRDHRRCRCSVGAHLLHQSRKWLALAPKATSKTWLRCCLHFCAGSRTLSSCPFTRGRARRCMSTVFCRLLLHRTALLHQTHQKRAHANGNHWVRVEH